MLSAVEERIIPVQFCNEFDRPLGDEFHDSGGIRDGHSVCEVDRRATLLISYKQRLDLSCDREAAGEDVRPNRTGNPFSALTT